MKSICHFLECTCGSIVRKAVGAFRVRIIITEVDTDCITAFIPELIDIATSGDYDSTPVGFVFGGRRPPVIFL